MSDSKDSSSHVALEVKEPLLSAEEKAANPGNALPESKSTNVQETAPASLWTSLPAFVPIVCWITLSGTVILMNKWILSEKGFNKPITLTTIHALIQTLATALLRKHTNLVDGAKELEASGKMTKEVFVQKIVPVGMLFSVSLILSNWVYLRLTVSFIQMLKACTPCIVLLISILFGVKTANTKLIVTVAVISLGVIIASYGEIQFDLLGFVVQLLAIVVESFRLVLIQKLLSSFGMNPLTSLYYFAPVVLIINSLFILPIEGMEAIYKAVELGPIILLGNGLLTFGLNLSSVWLIGKASGLTLTLCGVLKDILLIGLAFVIFGSMITPVQIFGYSIALIGLVAFKTQG